MKTKGHQREILTFLVLVSSFCVTRSYSPDGFYFWPHPEDEFPLDGDLSENASILKPLEDNNSSHRTKHFLLPWPC